jgi:DNA repair protein RecO
MITREVSPLVARDRLRTDWRACGVASYLAGLVGRITPSDAAHLELYHWMEQVLDEVATEGAKAPLLFWFELRLLALLGLAPRLQRCLSCGCEPKPGQGVSSFAYVRGGWLCPACRVRDTREQTPLPPDALSLLASWQRAATSRSARTTRCTARQLGDIERILGLFMVHHLEQPLTGREAALDLLARRFTPAAST